MIKRRRLRGRQETSLHALVKPRYPKAGMRTVLSSRKDISAVHTYSTGLSQPICEHPLSLPRIKDYHSSLFNRPTKVSFLGCPSRALMGYSTSSDLAITMELRRFDDISFLDRLFTKAVQFNDDLPRPKSSLCHHDHSPGKPYGISQSGFVLLLLLAYAFVSFCGF